MAAVYKLQGVADGIVLKAVAYVNLLMTSVTCNFNKSIKFNKSRKFLSLVWLHFVC